MAFKTPLVETTLLYSLGIPNIMLPPSQFQEWKWPIPKREIILRFEDEELNIQSAFVFPSILGMIRFAYKSMNCFVV